MNIFKWFIVILSLEYYIYSCQWQMAISILVFYFIGRLLLKSVIGIKSYKLPLSMYDLFFFIYGSLTLYSQIELISNPDVDYFIHFDASNSFYHWIVTEGNLNNVSFSYVFKNSLFNPIFSDYPLGGFLFSILAKVALIFDIINVRLFLRIHVFMLAAIIPALIANILLIYNMKEKKVKYLVFCFSLFSYLYITSSIFSRDLHVCLMYSLICYVILLPKCKYRAILLLLLSIMTIGFRPMSGILAFIFIAGHYMSSKNTNLFKIIFLIVTSIVVIIYMFDINFITNSIDRVDQYQNMIDSFRGGLFEKVYSLPFPINQIGVIIYMVIMPLPITKYLIGPGCTFLTLPFVLSPYLMIIIFAVSIWYLCKKWSVDKHISLLIFNLILVFSITIYGSPDLRRAFAVIPGLFMGYCIIKNKVPIKVTNIVKKWVWPAIFLINIVILFYIY